MKITHLILGSLLILAACNKGSTTVPGSINPEAIYHDGWIDFNKNGKKDKYENPQLPAEKRIKDLISQMTPEEKAGQLLTPYGWIMYERKNDSVMISEELKKSITRNIGGLWGFLRADPWTKRTLSTGLDRNLSAGASNMVQKYVIGNTRLGIPLILSEECPHGLMAIDGTVFPTSLGLSSTWDPDLIEKMGRAIAKEIRTRGSHIGYGPVLDIAREMRWSRVEETFGEDPYLTSMFGVSFVEGLQGTNPGDSISVISTLKAMAGHGSPEAGHNAGAAHIGEFELNETMLPPFRAAVRAGALSVMSSYNEVDGVPSTSSHYLFTDVLRGEWGFKGFVVSDLFAISGLTGHGVAADKNEAALKAISAGIDMDLGGSDYFKTLVHLADTGMLDSKIIDQAVSRVLYAKFVMGLFDHPFVNESNTVTEAELSDHRALARQIAARSVVLLKNENNILPLGKELKSIAVIGPNADNVYNMLGDYTAPQRDALVTTVLEGIRSHASENTVVRYAKGCSIRGDSEAGFAEALNAARNSDLVILVMGGSSARDFSTEFEETGAARVSIEGEGDMESGEGYDRATLNLMGKQEKLMEQVVGLGKPVVLVLIEGRPLNITWASQNIPAIINAWYPGMEGGNGIADVLFGDVNPAGRLTLTIPRTPGQIPIYYNSKRSGYQRNYTDESGKPLYPFGYGLSYTSFKYENLKVTTGKEEGKINVTAEITVTNTGSRDGDEVVQLYLRDNVSSHTTPPRTLKGFRRIHLKAGEAETVRFDLDEETFSIYQGNGRWAVEPGKFTIMIGASSADIRAKEEIEL